MKEKKVLMYTTTWCPDCRLAKTVFEELGIEFQEINIEEDEDAAMEIEELNNGFRSVPTIIFPDGSSITEPSRDDLISKLEDVGLIVDTAEGNS